MAGYRFYFLGTDGHIWQRIEYEAANDDLAIREARSRYDESSFNAGFEVWEVDRLVCCENTSPLREELHVHP